MKHVFITIAAIMFSTFFYRQAIGLNLLLFSISTLLFLGITNFQIFRKMETLLLASFYLLTGTAVFVYHSQLVVTANIICFFTLIGSASFNRNSLYIYWLNGFYTVSASFFVQQFNRQPSEKKAGINYLQWVKIILIPLVFAILFIGLYKNGNPVFQEVIEQIDLSFINFSWLLFTVMGYYLFYNMAYPVQIIHLTQLDLNTGNILEKDKLQETPQKKLENENQLGRVLLLTLNVLIVLYLFTDVKYLSGIQDFTSAELSKQVHAGINALIASILLAISIILYFFRGNLNFFSKNKHLKNLAFLWIILNLTLIASSLYKNYLYVFSYGLTYKRIGVFIYLLLTLIGLVTAFIKVSNIKNFWFLLRKNTQIAFVILVFSTFFSWDNLITRYNLYQAQSTDINYLINLPENNAILLNDYADKEELNPEVNQKIEAKYKDFIQRTENKSWQELTYNYFMLNH